MRSQHRGKRLVRYWYDVDGKLMHRPVEIKLRGLANSVIGRPTPAAAILISTGFADDREEATATLDGFTEQFDLAFESVGVD